MNIKLLDNTKPICMRHLLTLNSKILSLVKKNGDKNRFIITKLHCIFFSFSGVLHFRTWKVIRNWLILLCTMDMVEQALPIT